MNQVLERRNMADSSLKEQEVRGSARNASGCYEGVEDSLTMLGKKALAPLWSGIMDADARMGRTFNETIQH